MHFVEHEDDVFYDQFGLKIWKKRHLFVMDFLEKNKIKSVMNLFKVN